MKSSWVQQAFFMKKNFLKLIIVTYIGVLLAACSGGESGTGVQQDDTVVGPINGFGSVIVNGIKFNTDNTSIYIDGVPVSEDKLNIGMVVSVTGQVDKTGAGSVAYTINMEYEIKGLVLSTNIDAAGTGDIDVMGQDIIIDDDTKFSSEVGTITSVNQISELQTVVEVSGYVNGQGEVFATFIHVIEDDGEANEVKVKGLVSNLDMNSFDIGNINITYDNSTEFEGLDIGDLENGLFVTVESDIVFNSNNTSSFHAEEISLVTFNEKQGSEIEIEGVVTNDSNVGSGEFELGGRVVRFDGNTSYEGGAPENIVNDVKLEVEGMVQADGSVLAKEIEFREGSSIELIGYVESTTANSVTLLGQEIFVTEITSYEDHADETNRDFNLADVVAGNYLEVKVYVNTENGSLMANSISKGENQGESQPSEVGAVIAEINGGILTLEGMPTLIVDVSDVIFNGNIGDEIEASGNYNTDTLTLEVTSIEN